MHKLTKAAIIIGLATASVPTASQAAMTHGTQNQYESSEPKTICDEMIGGYMRTPRPAEIQDLVASHIALIPVCGDPQMTFERNNYGALFVNGNAELLRLPIARNPALINALRAKDYDQNDVVSVRFGGGNSIILYVHQRDMR